MKYTIYGLLFIALSCGNKQNSTVQNTKQAPTKKQQTEKVETATKNVKTVLGIDVSHYQGNVNWKDIKQDGVLFGYAKATQGAYYSDPKFQENWKNMTSNSIYRGAYHFYVYQDKTIDQANHFINTIKDTKGELPPVLDLERAGIDGEADVETYQKDVLLWLQTVEKALGEKPMIYTNTSFGNTYLNHPDFAEYKLWLAEYVPKNPTVPNAWKTKGWSIWQRSEEGVVNGITGNVDHDIFNGDLNAFNKSFFSK